MLPRESPVPCSGSVIFFSVRTCYWRIVIGHGRRLLYGADGLESWLRIIHLGVSVFIACLFDCLNTHLQWFMFLHLLIDFRIFGHATQTICLNCVFATSLPIKDQHRVVISHCDWLIEYFHNIVMAACRYWINIYCFTCYLSQMMVLPTSIVSWSWLE